jgi:hypothetical protein
MPWLGPAAAAAALALGCACLVAVDPNEPGGYPSCPFHASTGLWCPGCGSARALRALLHGDIAAAAGFNILMVLAVPFLAYSYLAWTGSSTGWFRLPRIRTGPALAWTLVAVFVGFGILRNLPVGPLTALAP